MWKLCSMSDWSVCVDGGFSRDFVAGLMYENYSHTGYNERVSLQCELSGVI